jgi:DNA-binding transcriptional MerR regulator
MPSGDRFAFTITDLALLLGKSSVTLRGWERQGLITFPRDPSGDRKFTLDDLRIAAVAARDLGRITEYRLDLVRAALTLLSFIEKENQ